MTNNINRKYRSYDVNESDRDYCDNHNGYRRSGKWGKRRADRFARRQGKEEIRAFMMTLDFGE